MNDDHERAQKLIDAGHVEGLTAGDRAWLDAHLEGCSGCAARAQATERALQSLRLIAPRVNPALVAQARLRVRLRAAELREYRSRLRALWICCVLSWILGALTAPVLLQAVRWIAERFDLPMALSVTLFVLGWSLPAAAGAAVLVWWRSQVPTETNVAPPRN
jgi:uncharacterized membrane protein YqjE